MPTTRNSGYGPQELPAWADSRMSRDLPTLRAKGEGQHLEYMSKFPDNRWDLAKEIAAFASSGGGQILIGVDNAGQLVGIDCEDVSQRDKYMNSIQGIARGTVNPAVTPRAGFACEEGRVVLFIRVQKGPQPVCYCKGKPYVRHLTESRPATPEEVIQRVLAWAGVKLSEEGVQTDDKSEYYWKPRLDNILVDLLIAIDEMPSLSLDPGPDYLQSVCSVSSSGLRQLIIDYLQDEDAVADALRRLADGCDEVVAELNVRHSETWQILEGTCPRAKQAAEEIRESLLGGPPVDESFLQNAKQTIKAAARKARDLILRADRMIDAGRQSDLLYEASEIGDELIRLAYYPLPFLRREDKEVLQEAARSLHLLPNQQQLFGFVGSHVELRRRIAEQTERIEHVAARID